MSELIRDTVLGHFLRLVTGKKVLLYPEEKDPEIWKKYVNKEKSANMASHGQPEAPKEDEKKEEKEDDSDSQSREPSRRHSSRSSSTIRDDSGQVNEVSGRPVDSEKGQDSFVVDWYGPDDPEVCKRSVLAVSRLIWTESKKLVASQAFLGDILYMSAYILRLHWFGHLHCRYSGCHDDLWCQPSRSNPWVVSFRPWLCSWTYDLGEYYSHEHCTPFFLS